MRCTWRESGVVPPSVRQPQWAHASWLLGVILCHQNAAFVHARQMARFCVMNAERRGFCVHGCTVKARMQSSLQEGVSDGVFCTW